MTDSAVRGLPRSRALAKADGSPHYFTGNPCKYGHIDMRYTSNGKCATCARNDCSLYHKRHLIDERFRKKQWAKENPQKNLEQTLRWEKDNPTKVIRIRRTFYENHTEQRRSASLLWAKNHPLEKRAQRARRRARKKSAEGSYTAKDILHIFALQKGCCYWCHSTLGDNYHVDHVMPLVKGGSNRPENLVIACPTCNLRKREKTPSQFAGRLF